MGKKNKIKKSIESFEKVIKEHEKKIEDYKEIGGKNYSLIDYWEKEIEKRKEDLEKAKKKLEK